MKKKDIILFNNVGVLGISNHTLDAAHAYKVVRFRKAINKVLNEIASEQEAMANDAGFDKPIDEFFGERLKLYTVKNPTPEQLAQLGEMDKKIERYNELNGVMLEQEVKIECPKIPYEVWRQLQNENKDNELNGRKVDPLSGYVEDVLEDVFWSAPKE